MTTLRTAVLALVWATGAVSADVYTYECGLLPTSAGFTLLQAWCGCPPKPCEGNQWIEDGNLFQQNGLRLKGSGIFVEPNPNPDHKLQRSSSGCCSLPVYGNKDS